MAKLSLTQQQRLTELNASEEYINKEFDNFDERNKYYMDIESRFAKENRKKLNKLLTETHKPLVLQIEEQLDRWLTKEEGFTRVSTPVIITSEMLAKMTITEEHHLRDQVFWIDNKR